MYARIFQSIYDGTLVEDWRALITFQQMLVLCDADGVVDMTPRAISRRTGIPIEHIEAGIHVLESPDPTSRTETEEGRRIIRIDPHREWGWKLVNYQKYKEIRSDEDRREYMRKYMADRRKDQKFTDVNSKQELAKLAHVDVDVNEDVNKSPLPPSGEIPVKKKTVALKTFLDDCHERKEKPVPETDPVFEYAASVGIPPEFLHLCWREFVDRHKDGGKRYRDWRKAFRNCVRGNWYRLWYADSGGGMALTTQGVLAKRKHTEAP